jgi:hypothetical protein
MLQYQCSVAFDSRVDLGCGGAALSKPKPNLPKSSQTLTKSAQKKSKKMTLISLAILSFFNELWRPPGAKNLSLLLGRPRPWGRRPFRQCLRSAIHLFVPHGRERGQKSIAGKTKYD